MHNTDGIKMYVTLLIEHRAKRITMESHKHQCYISKQVMASKLNHTHLGSGSGGNSCHSFASVNEAALYRGATLRAILSGDCINVSAIRHHS
jgi:hypothetical protein